MESEEKLAMQGGRMSQEAETRIYPCSATQRADVMERYRHMWRKGLFTDVIVRTTGKDYWAHSSYLAAWSDFLAGMLLARKGSNPVVLSFVNLDTFGVGSILDYIYDGHLVLCVKTLQSILQAALYMDVVPAVKSCLTFVQDSKYHEATLKVVVALVDRYPSSKGDTVLKTFIKHNINKLLTKVSISSLKYDFLQELLLFSEVNRKELAVFKAVLVWFHANKPTLETKRKLLQLIRYDLMSVADIKVIIACPPELVSGCESVILRAIGDHCALRRTTSKPSGTTTAPCHGKATRDFAQLVTSMHIDSESEFYGGNSLENGKEVLKFKHKSQQCPE